MHGLVGGAALGAQLEAPEDDFKKAVVDLGNAFASIETPGAHGRPGHQSQGPSRQLDIWVAASSSIDKAPKPQIGNGPHSFRVHPLEHHIRKH